MNTKKQFKSSHLTMISIIIMSIYFNIGCSLTTPEMSNNWYEVNRINGTNGERLKTYGIDEKMKSRFNSKLDSILKYQCKSINNDCINDVEEWKSYYRIENEFYNITDTLCVDQYTAIRKDENEILYGSTSYVFKLLYACKTEIIPTNALWYEIIHLEPEGF